MIKILITLVILSLFSVGDCIVEKSETIIHRGHPDSHSSKCSMKTPLQSFEEQLAMADDGAHAAADTDGTDVVNLAYRTLAAVDTATYAGICGKNGDNRTLDKCLQDEFEGLKKKDGSNYTSQEINKISCPFAIFGEFLEYLPDIPNQPIDRRYAWKKSFRMILRGNLLGENDLKKIDGKCCKKRVLSDKCIKGTSDQLLDCTNQVKNDFSSGFSFDKIIKGIMTYSKGYEKCYDYLRLSHAEPKKRIRKEEKIFVEAKKKIENEKNIFKEAKMIFQEEDKKFIEAKMIFEEEDNKFIEAKKKFKDTAKKIFKDAKKRHEEAKEIFRDAKKRHEEAKKRFNEEKTREDEELMIFRKAKERFNEEKKRWREEK